MDDLKLETRIFASCGNLKSACCKEFTVSTNRKVAFCTALVITACVFVFNYVFLWHKTRTFTLLAGGIALFSLARSLWAVEKETVALIVPICLQMTSTSLLGSTSTMSIPWSQLHNFMIMDVIIGQQVVFLLAVGLKGDAAERTLILFRDTRPRLAHLQRIYVELQTILDESR